ncbi:hypothetical protein PR202_gb25925 [Eleusine coracana subsp. coracana]|uniref:UBL3-like ubiquitin domain-containing protein n=1 Tax=Eleusine coracana subsp. coracana TaxID=191504 RepID=A0AAV5FQ79_ELECO|nr:hypothetical protein PR202_gb25925 [Eleusine coracana subsp. coracana]
MSGVQEQFEIKFRLPDGTDIGPNRYAAASSVATLKETIIAQWPKATGNGAGAMRSVLAWPSLSLGWILPLERPLFGLESRGVQHCGVAVRGQSLSSKANN